MSEITIIEGGVTAAKGFEAASTAAGIKYEGRTDMALVYSTAPCTAAGTFTSNVVKAAPVIWDRDIVRKTDGTVQAVVVNSGIANACTGEEGMSICSATAEAAGKALGIPAQSVLVGSTGVIGMQIPVDKITKGVRALAAAKASGAGAGTAAARAIMTTDTVSKEAAVTFEMEGEAGGTVKVTVGGMSKGSGMIHPNMCTMLAYITTDVDIDKDYLQELVSETVDTTFNMISVDGDTSTNDTLLVLANGLAGNRKITKESGNGEAFRQALVTISTTLAKMMAGDGEGATKLIESTVLHADTQEHAKVLAKSVICSNLTKAAIFGRDANWGRILCALGYAGVDFDPDKVDLYFAAGDHKLLIFTNGAAADYSEEEAKELLSGTEVDIISDLHMGEESATAWGCDLTYDYVKINADYRS
jgi:glutamate N-acetyltransferase/amino-acid N-acetyltransferase